MILLKGIIEMEKKTKRIYNVILLCVLIVVAIGVFDGWQTWFIPSQRMRQMTCLILIREYFLENSLLIRNKDGAMVINTESAPIESLTNISFFKNHNYEFNRVDSEPKPSRNKIVLVYNSDHLNPLVDWIAIAMGKRANFILYENGEISTTEDVEGYLKQSSCIAYYTYDKSE